MEAVSETVAGEAESTTRIADTGGTDVATRLRSQPVVSAIRALRVAGRHRTRRPFRVSRSGMPCRESLHNPAAPARPRLGGW
jgi:hypothetical protein